MNAALVLASTSRTRAAILANAGVGCERVAPEVDEEAVRAALGGADPVTVASTLAERKAAAVGARRPQALVLAADQVLDHGAGIFARPRGRDEARAQLERLSGRTHWLVSSACLSRGAEMRWRRTERVSLTMRPLSGSFIETYLDAVGEEAFVGPGCYRLEGLGAQLFHRVDGDFFAVLGLPLLPLLEALRDEGVLTR